MTPIDRLRRGSGTGSAEETRALAAELAGILPPNSALALHGDLGTGKTTFVQGLARGFGVAGPVTSPTFGICALYQGNRVRLVHLDAYRIASSAEADGLLLEEFLTPPYCLAVEWPDAIAEHLPAGTLRLEFGVTTDGRHTIRLR